MNKNIIVLLLITVAILAIDIMCVIIRVFNIVSYKFLFRLLPVIGATMLIYGLILLLMKRDKYIFILSICFILSLVISSFVGSKIIDIQRDKVFEDGNRIVHALEQYYKDNNKYPVSLSELVPKYIESVPKIKTTYDREGDFSYFKYGNNCFLGFENFYFVRGGWAELV